MLVNIHTRSNRPGRVSAASINSGRFVAAKTRTPWKKYVNMVKGREKNGMLSTNLLIKEFEYTMVGGQNVPKKSKLTLASSKPSISVSRVFKTLSSAVELPLELSPLKLRKT
jgi:hypothetical protein